MDALHSIYLLYYIYQKIEFTIFIILYIPNLLHHIKLNIINVKQKKEK